MTWKQKTVIRILILVAKIINEDEWLKTELRMIDSHISIVKDREPSL